jgi:hypothetical protein
MDQDTPVFKPRYPFPHRLIFFALPVLFVGMFCRGISDPRSLPVGYWYLVLLCGILTALAPFLLIREIRFDRDMVIRRYFLPNTFIKYRDLYTIEMNVIQLSQRRIRLGDLKNIDELKDMTSRWSARQALKETDRGRILAKMAIPSRGVGAYAGFWGLVLGTVVAILQPTTLSFDPRLLPGITFAIIYFLFVYIIPML